MAIDKGPLDFKAVVDNTDFNAQIAQIKRQIVGVSDTATTQARRMDSAFAGLKTAVAGAFTAIAAEQFVQQLIRVRGEFQQLEIAFTTMLKSKEKADQLMQQVKELAATTPFELKDVATGAKQLLAYGFQANEVTGVIKKLGDVAAGVSAPLNDIVYLYGTMRTQGRAYAQDIRQFTNRGIPIIQALADQFGVTADKVMELVSAGKVGFPQIEKAIDSMTSKTGQFYNLMQAQSASLTGQISNLHDSVEFMINDIGKSAESVLSGGISIAASLVKNYKEIFTVLGTIATGYGVYKAAVIATTIAERVNLAIMRESALAARELTAEQALMGMGIRKLKAAWVSLTAVMEANPIGVMAIALTGIVLGLETLLDKAKSTEDIIGDLGDSMKNFTTQGRDVDELAKRYEDLSGKVNRTKDENEQLAETMQKLASNVPSAVEQVDNFGNALRINLASVKGFNEALEKGNELILKNSIASGEARIKTLSEDIAKYQAIVNTRQTTIAVAGPNGTTQFRQVGASQQEVLDAARHLQELGKEYKSLSEKVTEAKKALQGGITPQIDDQEVKRVQTVREQIQSITTELKEQQTLLSKQRLPSSTATAEQIEDTIKKIKELKKELLTLTGPGGGVAPKSPITAAQIADLGQQASAALKASMEAGDKIIVDEAGDTMQKVMDRWRQGAQFTFDLQHTSAAAASFQAFFNKVFEDPFNDSYNIIKNKIKDIDSVLASGEFTDTVGDKIRITPAQQKALEQARDHLAQILETGNKIRGVIKGIGELFGAIANEAGQTDSTMGDVLTAMGGIVGYASDFSQAVDKWKSSIDQTTGAVTDSNAAFSAGISATTSAMNILASVMAIIQKQQQEAEQQRIDNIQQENSYLREQYGLLQDITGAEKAASASKLQEETRKQIELNNEAIQKQIDHLIKDSILSEKIWNKKKKRREQEHLDSVSAQLDAALEQKDYQKYIEILETSGIKMTGTMKAALSAIKDEASLLTETMDDVDKEFTGLSIDDLTSKIVDMFEQGKLSAEDFASTFEDLMKGAILNTFQSKFLQQQLAGWYDQFSKLAQSGDKLTSDEVTQLRGALSKIFDDAKTGWQQLQQAAGLDFSAPAGTTDASQGGLTGAIKGITADQAGIIAGQFNAMRVTNADVAKTVKLQLQTLSAIEQNTRYNSHLESIDRKLDALDQDILRAKGLSGG